MPGDGRPLSGSRITARGGEVAGSFLSRGHDGLAGEAPAQPGTLRTPRRGTCSCTPRFRRALHRTRSAEEADDRGGKVIQATGGSSSRLNFPRAAVQRVGARLVAACTTDPELRPNSAEKLLVWILNSWTASTFGRACTELPPSVTLATPSSWKFQRAAAAMHDVVHIDISSVPASSRRASAAAPGWRRSSRSAAARESLSLRRPCRCRRRGGLHGDARGHDRDGFVHVARAAGPGRRAFDWFTCTVIGPWE